MTRHKRRIATFVLIASMALFSLVSGFGFTSSAEAWNDCPKGLVNDPYPGVCRRYVDTNGDSICDLSQSEPVAATTTTAQPVTTTTTKTKDTTTTTTAVATTTTSGEPPTGNCPLGPCVGCGICIGISTLTAANNDSSTYTVAGAAAAGTAAAAAGSDTTSTTTPASGGAGGTTGAATTASGSGTVAAATVASGGSTLFTHYNVSPIAIALLAIYGISFFLYKTKRIKTTVHRKIWNVLLLGTFLITGIFGLILTIQLDYTLPFTIPINLLFWHVEAGVAMTLISFFHVSWHFNYYRNLVRSSRKKVRVARELESVRESEEREKARRERERRRGEREAPRGTHPRREFEPEL